MTKKEVAEKKKPAVKTLWHNTANMDEYIRVLDHDWTPSKTIRYSLMDGLEDHKQYVYSFSPSRILSSTIFEGYLLTFF